MSFVSYTFNTELLAGIVTYCIFWFEFPLSVICVSTLSIDILPTPSANIGNLPDVFSLAYQITGQN